MVKLSLAAVLCVSITVALIASTAYSHPFPDDDDRDFDEYKEQIKDDIQDFAQTVYGGNCVTDDQCSAISFCRKTDYNPLTGTCQLTWWIILLAIVLVVLLMAGCCACICCPCCLLYSCCDSICCCC